MSVVYVALINVILIFIAYVILNHKINKNSTSALLNKYAREVENLIVELNRTVDDVLNLSEERVKELKKLIKKAERVLESEPTPSEGLSRKSQEPRAGESLEKDGMRNHAQPARKRALPIVTVKENPSRAGSRSSPVSAPLYDVRGKKVEIKSDGEPTNSGSIAAPLSTGQFGKQHGGEPAGKTTGEARSEASVESPRVEVQPTQSFEEDSPRNTRRFNILERTRHLLSMGHSKEEIAKMLNLSRAEMDFLVSLHNK